MKPHKHAELIKAWADGAEIEQKCNSNLVKDFSREWHSFDGCWDMAGYWEYRIKPEPTPDKVIWLVDNWRTMGWCEFEEPPEFMYEALDKLKIIRDGTTGKIKSAEVIE